MVDREGIRTPDLVLLKDNPTSFGPLNSVRVAQEGASGNQMGAEWSAKDTVQMVTLACRLPKLDGGM